MKEIEIVKMSKNNEKIAKVKNPKEIK